MLPSKSHDSTYWSWIDETASRTDATFSSSSAKLGAGSLSALAENDDDRVAKCGGDSISIDMIVLMLVLVRENSDFLAAADSLRFWNNASSASFGFDDNDDACAKKRTKFVNQKGVCAALRSKQLPDHRSSSAAALDQRGRRRRR